MLVDIVFVFAMLCGSLAMLVFCILMCFLGLAWVYLAVCHCVRQNQPVNGDLYAEFTRTADRQ